MNKYLSKYLSLILTNLIGLTGISISGCSNKTADIGQHARDVPSELPPLPGPVPASLTLASGWSEINIAANSAKTKISTGAHFSTTRNACGHPAYGGIDLDSWNKLANSLNVAIQKGLVTDPLLHEEYCASITTPSGPDDWPYLVDSGNDHVDIKTSDGVTRTILHLREDPEKGAQICSAFPDTAASDELISAVTKVIHIADKEDCPNGWGSDY